MSLNLAMSNAVSGLMAASRGVELVSHNVANAGTEGYARRDLQLAAASYDGRGAGVRMTGVVRQGDLPLLNNLRVASAAVSGGQERLAFREMLGPLLGDGFSEGALSDRITTLAASLVEASSRPDSPARLEAAVEAARALTDGLNEASRAIEIARTQADDDIGDAVAWLNEALGQVQQLNREIVGITASRRDASALIDQREVLINQIAEWIPVQEMQRDHGAVALVTPGGAVLLDGNAATLGFVTAGHVVAEMEVGGALSTVTLGGREVSFTQGEGMLGGGRLGALFDVRDNIAVEAQASLDALAVDLYARFSDPAVAMGVPAGQPGLVTDEGGAFDPSQTTGLAGRIGVNAAVDPQAGGEVWRLRDGLAAVGAGPVGNSALLTAMVDALEAPRTVATGPLAGLSRSAGGLVDEAAARWSSGTALLERSLAVSGARADTLQAQHLENGVDTDHEMQKLMALEHAYGANARVLSVIDEMMQQLLRI